MKDISIIIPAYNESESLTELQAWISKVADDNNYRYEIIIIDDGSSDDTWKTIKQLNNNNPDVRGVKFRRNYGKSAALNIGFEMAQGRVVITMDADLQDSPDEIPALYEKIANQGRDIVSGWKKKRYDPLSKTIPTRIFNAVTRKISGIKLHDFNCGLKAYSRAVIKNIEVYGEMHRYVPVIAKWAGFNKIDEHIVKHSPRKYGKSKFGINRFTNGFLDLLSIFFVGKFSQKPMHFFGTIGLFSFILGFSIVILLIGEKLFAIYRNLTYRDITQNPMFYIALTSAIIGFQLFLTGFLAELVSRNAEGRNKYQIEDRI